MEKVAEKKVELGERDKETTQKEGKKWEKPTLEDVSGQVMAQPYIRFT